jgi:hypothetical protein
MMAEQQDGKYQEYIRALTARDVRRTAHTEWLESKGLTTLGDWPHVAEFDCLFGAIKRACAAGSSTLIPLLPVSSLQVAYHGYDSTHADVAIDEMRKASVGAVKVLLSNEIEDTLKTSAKACLTHIKSCVNPDDPRSVADADAMAYWEQRMTNGAHTAISTDLTFSMPLLLALHFDGFTTYVGMQC